MWGVWIGAVAAAALMFVPAHAGEADLRGSLALNVEAPVSVGSSGDAGEIIFSAVQASAVHKAVLSGDPADPAVRILSGTPDDVEGYFDLYLYVSKAAAGPIAQHMFVYERGIDGSMTLRYDWPVSTGREKKERTPSGRKTFTSTPVGIFKLDPNRFHKLWRSRAWNADMPWTMFLDTIENGGMSGIAIHAAGRGKISQLGRRASGGCIRLAPENAETLFKKIRKSHAGLVPVFAMNGDSTNLVGEPARLEDGSVELTYGYRVMLFIEDYAGEHLPTLAAASYVPTVTGAP